uniref:UDENN domain-containing protein n=1 Tax=Heterorhabditis bacteriophora TaxID=37862 RepID=A0A1I7XS09_HETBA
MHVVFVHSMTSSRDDDRRLFEHFVIAGLNQDTPEQLSPSSQECGCRSSQPLAPITDICAPEGYEIIDTTQLGYPADLNHGSLRMPSVFLCFRRGYHKPPLLDIGVLDYGRGEKSMVDSNIVQTTPFGRPANVNNASQGIFLTYRRALPSSAPSQFVVTDICVILANKGEIPLHTYYKIPKNLNKVSLHNMEQSEKGMLGSDVYICYKKSQCSTKRLAYKPSVLDYFPRNSLSEGEDDFKLAQNIPMFCLPMGALIECWPVKCQPPDKSFSTFVLTDENGNKFYGAAVTFYEKYRGRLSEEQLENLELNVSGKDDEGGAVEDSSSNNDPADEMYEVSFPTPRRPHVVMQLGAESISFDSHDDSQLPLNGSTSFFILHYAWLMQSILGRCNMFSIIKNKNILMEYFPTYLFYITSEFKIVMNSLFLGRGLETFFITYVYHIHLSFSIFRLSKQGFDINTKKADFVPVDREMLIQKKRKELETEIQDAFLRFMTSLMRGYQSFLRPIKSAPASANATDTGNLFDLDGFLRSRDKSGMEFFKRFAETQSFIRFIEERSFVSDKNAYNAFFDDCIAKMDSADGQYEICLLETETSVHGSHPTVFIAAPEPIIDPSSGLEREFKYERFPRKLDQTLFQLDQLSMNLKSDDHRVPVQHEISRCAAVRTKPEVRSSLLAATNAVRTNVLQWSKTILFYSYSLWFMQLPSLLVIAPNKKKILRLAFHVLDRIERTEVFPLDQVCYRILIELCGECNEPSMAVRVLQVLIFQAMQRAGLEQNAVTYGIYHRAVLNAEWPTKARQRAMSAWTHLRIVLMAVVQFKSRVILEPRRTNASSDAQSVSDRGYYSDKTAEELKADEEEVKPQPYVISYHPLDNNRDSIADEQSESPLLSHAIDPLGALSSNLQTKAEQTSQSTMSPSRAKFLADHETAPFASETTPKVESKGSGKSSSWLRGITNSPLMKMIRSQTFGKTQ